MFDLLNFDLDMEYRLEFGVLNKMNGVFVMGEGLCQREYSSSYVFNCGIWYSRKGLFREVRGILKYIIEGGVI